MKRLTRSETILAGTTGALVFLLLNFILLSNFFKGQARLRADIISKTGQLQALQTLVAEHELWNKREAWLLEKQPKLSNENSAAVQLLDQIKQVAKSNDVLLENPAIGSTDKTQFYRSVPVSIETKSSWSALIAFLRTLQQPDQFIVFENANIQIDAGDASLMHGKFKIARWCAP
jgi:Tfp pilus assembly protein PilO